MVVSKALRATGCSLYHLSLLRKAALLPFQNLPAAVRFHATKISRQQIRFSSQTRLSEQNEAHKHEENLESQDLLNEDFAEENSKDEYRPSRNRDNLDDQEPLDEGEVNTDIGAVPWYLQAETPQTAPKSLSERQKLPDLPELPPPILQPMLQHISVELGLDDLTLLDLRKLDPPPALGANLIMLIGTARSEKHLHVSADRLCRWLRSTHKLRPSADGLLGRNELKLKLRRKSRRAKLLGSPADENADDGIRTGWVCVDIGVVESPEMHASAISEGDGFVGFGRRTDGVRIVVQMLTEEKREEIDLERLWGGILRRSGRSEAEDGEVEVVGDTEVVEILSESNLQPSQHTAWSTVQPRGFQIPPARQFHTSARKNMGVPLDQQQNGILSSPQQNGQFENSELTELQRSVLSDFSLGEFEKAKQSVLEYCANHSELTSQDFLLSQLKAFLESISENQAIACLGEGYLHGNTTFMKCFKDAVAGVEQPGHLPSTRWDHVFWLSFYARDIGHPWFTTLNITKLFSTFKKRKFDNSDISDEYYHKIIRTLLEPSQGISYKSYAPTRVHARIVSKVIKTMHRRDHKILTEEMFLTLQEATERAADLDIPTVQPEATINDSFELPTMPMGPIQRRIHTLMMNLELPPFSDESRMRLMHIYARNGHWIAFWDIWRLPLRQAKPQSAEMYAYMFIRVAETGHQKACMKTLRTWIENLVREDCPVKLEGDVAEAVKACLLVASPDVEEEAIRDPRAPGEWASLWRKCHGGDEKWKHIVAAAGDEYKGRVG